MGRGVRWASLRSAPTYKSTSTLPANRHPRGGGQVFVGWASPGPSPGEAQQRSSRRMSRDPRCFSRIQLWVGTNLQEHFDVAHYVGASSFHSRQAAPRLGGAPLRIKGAQAAGSGAGYQIFTSLSPVWAILSPGLHWNACANCGMLAAAANARILSGACGSMLSSSSAVFSRVVPSHTRAELRKN